jgi:hypothetical protein
VLCYKKEGRKEGRRGGRKEVYEATDDMVLINDTKLMLLEPL